ncbi:MAG: hypothetical protein KU38_03790 [Sulfurovum sp. FS08-3]|nr:MAG: hypothetical protein KU38_03790 [Sulfurovum sp. FS08-3]
MKKQIFYGLLLSTVALEAIELKHDGYVRWGYQSFKNNASSEYDSAIGGKLNVELQQKGYFALGATFYTTNALSNKENIGVPFYSSQNNSYTLLGEAYLRLKLGQTKAVIGRQLFDSPFANSDDVGMTPNTFEGIVVTSKEIPNAKIVGAYLAKWSGVDSDTPQEFTRLNGDRGLYILGGVYGGVENLKLKAWFYNLQDNAMLSYFEANYDFKVDEVQVALATQYSVQDYENGDHSTIYGAFIEASTNHMRAVLAYNEVDGGAADNFFGGGPFFTSAQHITVTDGGDNATALLLGASLDLGVVGIENLVLGVSYLDVERQRLQAINEFDVTLEYSYAKNLNLQLIYSDIEDKSFNDESFKNVRVFVNYSF